MSEKLKPCPRCGSEDLAYCPPECEGHQAAWSTEHSVYCHGCDTWLGSATVNSEDEMIAAWNRRTPTPQEPTP